MGSGARIEDGALVTRLAASSSSPGGAMYSSIDRDSADGEPVGGTILSGRQTTELVGAGRRMSP